jgi:hypothetical protein
VQQRDEDGLAGPDRNLDAQLVGESVELGDGEPGEVDDGTYGAVDFIVRTCSCNRWDDLGWLLMVRNEADMYIGPDRTVLFDVVDEHIHRVLSGHAACGGGPAMPERPRR